MLEFLKRHRKPSEPPSSVSAESMLANHSEQPASSRRETIRVVFKDTLRMHGIPIEGLGCETLIVRRSNKTDEVHIQVVMLKWNEKLLRYAPALEQQLRHELDRMDPTVDHSKYIISWRFSPDRNYPFSVLPDPKFWVKDPAPKIQSDDEPISVLDRRRTRRSLSLPKSVSVTHDSVNPEQNYAATQLAPLR